MYLFRALFLTSLMLAAGFACGQSVQSSYDKEYRLSRLRTYEYKVEERDRTDLLAADTLMDQKIKEALEDALLDKAYHQAGGGTPDFLISYHVTTKDMTGGRRLPLRGAPGPRGNLRVDNYVQGTLVVDFLDAETKKLVWRGVASGIVGGQSVDFTVADEMIKAACRKLLEQFRKDLSAF